MEDLAITGPLRFKQHGLNLRSMIKTGVLQRLTSRMEHTPSSLAPLALNASIKAPMKRLCKLA